MPNSRRRKFSVQNAIGGPEKKSSHASQVSSSISSSEAEKSGKNSKSKIISSSTTTVPLMDVVAESESSSSVLTVRRRSTLTVDKDVTASSSNIDLFNIFSTSGNSNTSKENNYPPVNLPTKRNARQVSRDSIATTRREKPRQHRIKVRSPKRRTPVDTQLKPEISRRSIGTDVITWEREHEVFNIATEPHIVEIEEYYEERQSDHSLDDMCRICHGGDSLTTELGQLISACSCRGTVGRVHVRCLERWLTESGKSRCELCGTRYVTRRVHRYGVPRALVMWILSQNAKQLMVDSLGIMLMSPLAVLAAWLSGRTLAGLMTQESHVTPWPLASTFVLACMTLVCYYCWIVSAATRHALGWWIWYRSQYEVRLQLQENEE